jgi:hypothetical protein
MSPWLAVDMLILTAVAVVSISLTILAGAVRQWWTERHDHALRQLRTRVTAARAVEGTTTTWRNDRDA